MAFYLLASVVVVFSIAAVAAIGMCTEPLKSRQRLGKRVFILASLPCLAGILVMHRYSYIPSPGESGIRFDGIHLSEFSEPTMCWHRECIELAKKTEVEGEVRPITENPKVRHLKYQIEVEIVDPILFARSVDLRPDTSCPDQGPRNCRLHDVVMFEIYEFNNANSKELARFYNPYDQRQTDALQALMLCKLDEALVPKGINFRRLISWSVE